MTKEEILDLQLSAANIIAHFKKNPEEYSNETKLLSSIDRDILEVAYQLCLLNEKFSVSSHPDLGDL